MVSDRAHGKEFCRQFEDSCVKVEEYVVQLEREIEERKCVLEMCADSEVFYEEQFKEARIVANVSTVSFISGLLFLVVLLIG